MCLRVKKQSRGGVFWSVSYFAYRVWRHGDENMVKNYVSGQGWEYQKIHEDT